MRDLTARQREVLRLVAAGCSSSSIGRRLGIHRNTVDRHLAEIYQRLGAHDRSHAVALAIYHGQITLPELAAIAGAHSKEAAA